jgi:CheY-specific phosphatase CheX
LLENYFAHFTGCLKEVLWDMAQIECVKSEISTQGSWFSSQGLAIIIGITGMRQGRMIMDFSWPTALVFAQKVYGKADLNDDEVLNSVAEFANIVCGRGVSQLNNSYKMELRVTPPSILFGDTLNIVNPKIKASLASIETSIGQLNLSVGFLGGK